MAGWTCRDKEKICWDGTICADSYLGDGSRLTGIAAGGGGGTLWASAANIISPIAVTQAISGAGLISSGVISGASIYSGALAVSTVNHTHAVAAGIWTNKILGVGELISGADMVSGAGFITEGTVSGADIDATGDITVGGSVDGVDVAGMSAFVTANTTHRNSSGASHSELVGCSGAITTHVATSTIHFTSGAIYSYTDSLSGALDTLSGAHDTLYDNYQITSGSHVDLSGAHYILSGAHDTHVSTSTIHFTSGAIYSYTDSLSGAVSSLSGALDTHTQDSTDPHGVDLTQTHALLGSGAITSDWEVISGAYIANVVYGTGATPPTASGFTRGTVYLQYTP